MGGNRPSHRMFSSRPLIMLHYRTLCTSCKEWSRKSHKPVNIPSTTPQCRLSALRPGGMFAHRKSRAKAPSPLSLFRTSRPPILQALLIAPGVMLRPLVPPIRAKPTPPTGSIFQLGAGGRTSVPCPRIRKPLGFILPPEDIVAMVETLDRGSLRGLRDRAMLLIGFAGGLRRSEIVGLDLKSDQTEDGRGWIEILDKGMLITLRGKTGWREVEVGRGSADATCPVAAIETWIKFARLAHGPLFRPVTGQGKAIGSERLNDKEVARLVKRAAMAAGVRGDLSESERAFKFSGHSLRAGLASSAEVDERYVQKQLGHASAEMTRRYQRRRDRFRVNLTKASGL